MRTFACLATSLALTLSAPALASNAESYLRGEAGKILSEGDRIKGEADKMRSEATRLNSEAEDLRKAAVHLDSLWSEANHLAPEKYPDADGRDKSQTKMRADASREDNDAEALRREGQRLDDEAMRLWKLAAAVNPQAQKDLIERFRACCKTSDLKRLRDMVAALASEMAVRYRPLPIE